MLLARAKIPKILLGKTRAACAAMADVPRTLSVLDFAAERSDDIKALAQELGIHVGLGEGASHAQACEFLPRHLRRRNTSHKRRSRRPRRASKVTTLAADEGSPVCEAKEAPGAAAARATKSGDTKTATPERTKARHLATHRWHAKRMKMCTRWGYRLPARRSDCGVRAAYRWRKDACTIIDTSYMVRVRVTGAQPAIMSGLAQMLPPPDHNVFPFRRPDSRAFSSGSRGGRLLLYQSSSYPLGLFGPAHFRWLPPAASQEIPRTLELWLHPGYAAEALASMRMDVENQSSVSVHVDKDRLISRFEVRGRMCDRAVVKTLQRVYGLSEERLPPPAAKAPRGAVFVYQNSETDNPRQGGEQAADLSSCILTLVQTPRPRNSGGTTACAGWDIIVEGGSQAARHVWTSLVLAGARAIGMETSRYLSAEEGSLVFPFDFPDTKASSDWVDSLVEQEQHSQNMKPKSKRNMAVATASVPRWDVLWRDKSGDAKINLQRAWVCRAQRPTSDAGAVGGVIAVRLIFPGKGCPNRPGRILYSGVDNQSRDIGFTTFSSYAHSRGKGFAIGFICLDEWRQWKEDKGANRWEVEVLEQGKTTPRIAVVRARLW